MAKEETVSLHVIIPKKIYVKLWEYVKTCSGSPHGQLKKTVIEALTLYLESRGVKLDE